MSHFLVLKDKMLRAGSLVLFALVLQSMHPLQAQTRIYGEVKNDQKLPVSYANMLLLHPTDSSLVSGAITDEEGKFSLKAWPRDYFLRVTMLGYQETSTPLTVTKMAEQNLGVFRLDKALNQLNEVVVKAQKPLFEKQIDRTIVNVKSSVTSAGSTVLDVLEKSPGVLVNRQNNSIAMNGKNGVAMMINGKLSRLPADALVQMLNGMSATNVEKIELITSPPAKYDAEGNGGIIHLVMEENENAGTNGNFGATIGHNRGETWGLNGSVNHRRRRVNTFLTYSILSDRNVNQWNTERFITSYDFVQINRSSKRRNPLEVVQNLRMGLQYDLSDKTSASVLLTGYRRNWDSHDIVRDTNAIRLDSTVITTGTNQALNRWNSATASLGLRHRLNERQTIDASIDYLYYHQINPSDYDNSFVHLESNRITEEHLNSTKVTPIRFQIASFDYTNVVSNKLTMEAGLKGSLSRFTNLVGVTQTSEGITRPDPQFTGNSTLDEKIGAAYGSAHWQPNRHWDVRGGLRYEYTDTYLSTEETAGLVDREFGNLFPSLAISHTLPRDSSRLSLAYSRRITRPTYNDLAPFVHFVNPTTVLGGNLSLRPAISDGVELSYQRKQWWVSVKYNHTQNAVVPFQPEIDAATNRQIQRSQNLNYLQSYSLQNILPISLGPWLEFRNDISLNYYQYQTKHLATNPRRGLVNFTYNGTLSFRLPREYALEVTGYHQSGSPMGLLYLAPLGRLDIGFKKQLKNDRGTLSLVGTDLFDTTAWRLTAYTPEANIHSSVYYNWNRRGVTLTYSRTLGNKKLKKVNITTDSEAERSRVQ